MEVGGSPRELEWAGLARSIVAWGRELGFAAVGIADTNLAAEETCLAAWLDAGRHGHMDYMAQHGTRRSRPADLVPGTVRVITARLDYWPASARDAAAVLADPERAYVSRYALGRDYHKVLRAKLATLARRIEDEAGPFGWRVFTDSAPVMEVALAANAGTGWRGKHTLLLTGEGSLFFLGDSIFIDGRPLLSLAPIELARTFAVVPQSSSTDFVFSAYDIVMMGRIPHMSSRLTGYRKSDVEIVRSAMEKTDTLRFASRPFYSLSGGERQRVVIARAIAQQPQGLLLDEPTVYLDMNGQFEIMDLIKKLNRDGGISVVAVLHDVNVAARYCDRIALLSQGHLEAIGEPKEVLTPEIIQSVYGIYVVVRKDPFSNAVYVMPHSTVTIAHTHAARVHLPCGGGTGGPVMKALLDEGFAVSAGVLNVLDSDYQNAEDLHVAAVAETPFSPIGESSHSENLKLIDGSSAVVVSPFPAAESVEFGGMTVNLATRTLAKNGANISLTTGEFALLKVLVTHPRVPLSRDKLMELARGREDEVFDRAIDVQVSRLRKLVEPDPANPTFIQTVWGFGYVFVPDGTKA